MTRGALDAAGVRRVGYGRGPQRAYIGRGGGILCRHAHSLFCLQETKGGLKTTQMGVLFIDYTRVEVPNVLHGIGKHLHFRRS